MLMQQCVGMQGTTISAMIMKIPLPLLAAVLSSTRASSATATGMAAGTRAYWKVVDPCCGGLHPHGSFSCVLQFRNVMWFCLILAPSLAESAGERGMLAIAAGWVLALCFGHARQPTQPALGDWGVFNLHACTCTGKVHCRSLACSGAEFHCRSTCCLSMAMRT